MRVDAHVAEGTADTAEEDRLVAEDTLEMRVAVDNPFTNYPICGAGTPRPDCWKRPTEDIPRAGIPREGVPRACCDCCTPKAPRPGCPYPGMCCGGYP